LGGHFGFVKKVVGLWGILGLVLCAGEVRADETVVQGVTYRSPGVITNDVGAGLISTPTDRIDVDCGAKGNVRGFDLPVVHEWGNPNETELWPAGRPIRISIDLSISRFAEVRLRFEGRFLYASAMFLGSRSYTARVDGVKLPFANVGANYSSTLFTVNDFDTVNSPDATTRIRVVYGAVRPDAFTIVIEQHGKNIYLTPDGPTLAHATSRFDKVTVSRSTPVQRDRGGLAIRQPQFTTVTTLIPTPILPPSPTPPTVPFKKP
jgi:hypothetical protein